MTTLYVNPRSGSAHDVNPGTSATSPLRTLGRANALATPGDLVLVYPSTYQEQVTLAASGVTWRAVEPGAVIDGSSALHEPWAVYSGDVWVVPFGAATSVASLYAGEVMYDWQAPSLASLSYERETHTQIVENSYYLDSAAKLLYLSLGGPSPNDVAIRYGARRSCLELLSLRDCVVDGFELERSNAWGVRVNGGQDNQVLNCRVWQTPSGGVRIEAPTPQLFIPKDNGAGGSLAAGTYTYQVTAIVGGVETAPSPVQSVTVAANRVVMVQWAGVVGATEYRVYGRASAGTLIVSIPPPDSGFPTWNDDGSLSPNGATTPPYTTTVKSYGNLVEHCDVLQTGSHGIAMFNASRNVVRGCRSHHNSAHGVSLQRDSSDNVVELCSCWSNWKVNVRSANGIMADFFGVGTPGSPRNDFVRNLAFRNQDSGISIYNGSSDCRALLNLAYLNGDHGIDNFSAPRCHMISNTVYGCTAAGLNCEGGASGGGEPSVGIRMYNNVASDNGVMSPRTTGNYRVDAGSSADAELDHNLSYLTVPATAQTVGANAEVVWGVTNYKTHALFRAAVPTQQVHGVAVDPLYVDRSIDDYRLSPASPGRGLATTSAPHYQGRSIEGELLGATAGAYS